MIAEPEPEDLAWLSSKTLESYLKRLGTLSEDEYFKTYWASMGQRERVEFLREYVEYEEGPNPIWWHLLPYRRD